MPPPGRPIGFSWRAIAGVYTWAPDVLTVRMHLVPGAGGMGLVFLPAALEANAWPRAARRNSRGA